jgi:hypothetical protein
VAIALLPAASARAGSFAFSNPAPLPGSPPGGTASGGEPSLAFDPTGDGHVYVTAPQRRPPAGGVNFWRSSDHGASFQGPTILGSSGGGSDSDVLAGADHTVFVADLEVAGTAICRSHDFGKTFEDGCDSGTAQDQTGPVSDREWLSQPPGDPKTLYDTYDGLGQGTTPQVMVSHDGGSTWQPCGQVLEPGSDAANHFTATGATENSEVIGRPAIARDGTMYIPFTLPRNQGQIVTGETGQGDITESAVFVALSPPGGCTPTTVFHDLTIHDQPGSDMVSIFPNAAIDGGGNVYISGAGRLNDQQKQQGVYVWVSRDRGKSFSAARQVNTPDIGAAQLQTVAAGKDAGEVLLGWYGATNVKDSNDQKGVWRYYMAQSFDYGQTFDQATVTPTPFHYGNICNKGIICGDSDNRNLLDFTSVDVDPATGCSFATFAGDPFNPPGASTLKRPAAYTAKQTDGPCLAKGVGAVGGAPGGTGGAGGTSRCVDRIPPQSRFGGKARLVRRAHLRLHGRATDRGCGRLGRGRVTRVTVSIARATGNRCRFLQADNRFSAPRSCLRTSYLRARGTSRWTFTTGRALPKGSYKIWSRAVDSARNVERKAARRNLTRVRVR